MRAFKLVLAGVAFGCALLPATAQAAGRVSPSGPTPMPAESGPQLSGFVAGGGSLRWLYDVPIRGLEVAAGLGPRDEAARPFNVYVVPRFFFGSTRAGLGVQQLTPVRAPSGASAALRTRGAALLPASCGLGALGTAP